ncbi:MAG: hypothetical protein AB8B80_06150 [Marinicellaceae bacterium]
MITKHFVTCYTLTAVLCLSACGGGNYSRYNQKQSTVSDIKISQFNIDKQSIDLRFEYRTYQNRILEKIKCNIDFNSGLSSSIIMNNPEIKLDAFSTEILSFSEISIPNSNQLKQFKNIDYTLRCDLKYDKGSEDVFEKSVLHLIPGSQYSYR